MENAAVLDLEKPIRSKQVRYFTSLYLTFLPDASLSSAYPGQRVLCAVNSLDYQPGYFCSVHVFPRSAGI